MTISEIAKMAGVSPAAVSRYLNNGYISDDKKQAIRKVIEETGYKPSLQAQILRTKKTKLICVILCLEQEDRIGAILSGISEYSNQFGYDILLLDTNGNTSKIISCASTAKNRCADGIILLSSNLDNETIQSLTQLEIPFVLAGCKNKSAHCVYHDHFAGASILTELMILKNKCKFAYIGLPPQEENEGTTCFEGFRKSLAEHGIPLDMQLISLSESSISAGYKAAEKLLNRCSGIDALICGSDALAFGARQYITEHTPNHEILVSGFGHTILTDVISPSLITVDLNDHELGNQATECLFQVMSEQNNEMKFMSQPVAVLLVE